MSNTADHRYLCACTAEIRRLTGVDPAACRAFVEDFAPLFRHLATRGLAAPVAARAGAVFGWAAMLAGRDAALRPGRGCRVPEVIGGAAAAALLRDVAAEPRLARLARAALERAQVPRAA